MLTDNPAARLHKIIKTGSDVDLNAKCRDVWYMLLNCNGDPALLMSRLGKVMELPAQIIAIVKEHFPDQIDTCNHWSSQLHNAFLNQTLNGQWQSFRQQIDSHTLMYLQLTSSLIQTKCSGSGFSIDSVADIRKNMIELCEEVLNAELDESVKEYVVRSIRKILIALEEHQLTGVTPILDAIDSMIGHAVPDKVYRNFMTDHELGKRLFDYISVMANLVTLAVGIPQISYALMHIPQ